MRVTGRHGFFAMLYVNYQIEKKKLVPFDVTDYIFICPGGPVKQYLALTLVRDLDSHISAVLYII